MLFWSPDGRFIGFYADGKLKKIPADGGMPLPVCDLFEPWAAAWNSQGLIFAAAAREKSALVQVDSGSVTMRKPVFWPSFLPDGKHLLYVNVDSSLRRFRTYVEDLSSGRQTELGPTDTRVFFCPEQPGASLGDLLYCKSGTLLAQRFDSGRLSAAGEPVPIADHVPYFRPTAWSEFTVSQDGTVVFSTGFPKTQLTWLDRSGRELGTVWQPQPFWGDLRISPDGLKVAASIADIATGGSDICICDLTTGTGERLTFEPGVEAMSVWSRDGKRVSYGNAQAAAPQLRMKPASGRGTEEAFAPGPFQLPFDWSSDGRWIFYQTSGNDVDAEIWVASPASRKVLPLVQGPFDHSQPCLSPDGQCLGFIANETGRDEIYVQHFEDGEPPRLSGERTRVSQNGGYMPR